MLKSNAGAKKGAGKNKAVALRYRLEEDNAPVVIASGYGQMADKIIGVAEEKGIPVFKDDSAASMLCMLEVGRDIPPELYEVIAAIYMQILSAAGKLKHSAEPSAATAAPLANAEKLRRQLVDSQNAPEN